MAQGTNGAFNRNLVFAGGVIGGVGNGESGGLTLTRGEEAVGIIVGLPANVPAPKPSKGPDVSLSGKRRREKIVNGRCPARSTNRASCRRLLFAGGVIGGIGNGENGGFGERGAGMVSRRKRIRSRASPAD